MSVKIINLEVENVKKIKAVQLSPAATGLTIIGGNNAQGKTSILDAIAWALGGDKFRPAAAQRDGALAPPKLHVKLSNGLVVERRGKNSALTVTDPSGRKAGQQLLNGFVEQLAIDLPRFLSASDKEKADTLLKIIGVGDQLAILDRDIKALYDKRTAIGQIAAAKKHFAEEMVEYPDAPDQPISAMDLIRQQQKILAKNGENQKKRDRLAEIIHEKHRVFDEARRLEEQIAALQEKLEERKTAYEQAARDEEIAMKGVTELQDESTAELERSLADIELINTKVRANLDKSKAQDEANSYADQYSALTVEITDKRKERTDLLDGADLPLPGLSVEDGCLTYQGKRWGDMSGADQLRVGTAIVRKLNPSCGFVLLDKLEQMDLHTLREFGDWLTAEGLQAIATRVSTGDECQIIIEDGTVVGAEDPEPRQWTKGAF